MIKITRSWTRPNTTVYWHFQVLDTGCWNPFFEDDTLLSNTKRVSLDGLTVTNIAIWLNQAAWEVALTNPSVVAYFQEKVDYNNANMITETPPVIEEI